MDHQNLDKRLQELESFRQKHMSSVVAIELKLGEASASVSSSATVKGVEMEKSKAPTFSGKTIDYPEFKRGWKAVAGKVWEDSNQVEQLKLKVDAETRKTITRCKTMTEVWDTLDKEYAQEQDVINAVNEELKTLRLSDCSTEEYIVKLRKHLPNLEDILNEVQGLEFLQNPDRVNYLVDKFDERTLHEWVYFRSKGTGSTYKRFMEFLIDRYDAARSLIQRKKSQDVAVAQVHVIKCNTCFQDGHFTNNCPQIASNSADDCKRCQNWVARDKVHTCPGCGRGTPKDQKLKFEKCHSLVVQSMLISDWLSS